MKRIKSGAVIFIMLAMCSTRAYAQSAGINPAGKADGQAQKMNEAFERLKDSMSMGGNEGVSSAGDGVFSSLGGFGEASVDNAVRAPMSKVPRKSGLIKAAEATCWEVCVRIGPLNVCYAWEKRCQ